MIVAPIIHTRTLFCDFNSEFLVRPDKFRDVDIKWARKNVLEATKEIDSLQGVRWLIADKDEYRMAGVIGFLKEICSKCNLSENDKMKSEELYCDNKGRLVYAFIGVVIDKSNNVDYGILSLEYLWSIYLHRIYPIWKRTYQEVILEGFTNINVEAAPNTSINEAIQYGSKKMYEANAASDYELFLDFLCRRDKTKFSFCSNILDFNTVKEGKFSVITTSHNIITRIERGNVRNPQVVSKEHFSEEKLAIDVDQQSQISETKKKDFMIFLIGLTIFVIIILVLLLM